MANISFSFSVTSGCCSLIGSFCSFVGSFFAVTGDLDLDLLSLGRRSDMFLSSAVCACAVDMEQENDVLVSAVNKLAKDLHQVVEEGRKSFKYCADINDFVQSRGPDQPHGLYAIYPVSLYVECFRSAGVATRKELEERWSRHFHDTQVRESVEELLAAEDAYNTLMEEIEKEMQRYEDQTSVPLVSVGDSIPADLNLMEASSGEMVPLQTYCSKAEYTLFILRKHFI